MEQLVLDLTNPQTRENALLELSKKRESFPELAPYLWHSFGTISALLQVHLACWLNTEHLRLLLPSVLAPNSQVRHV